MATRKPPDITQYLGLPMNALFGLYLIPTVLVFGPFVAAQMPSPGREVMWGATVLGVLLGVGLVLRSVGPAAIMASIRSQPRFWLVMALNLVVGIAAVIGSMRYLDWLVG